MSLFPSNGADAAYDRWMEPKVHDVDHCRGCHESGEHEKILYWYKECRQCNLLALDRVRFAAYELSHTMDDLATAEDWAKANKYTYDSIGDLLWDAREAGVIREQK